LDPIPISIHRDCHDEDYYDDDFDEQDDDDDDGGDPRIGVHGTGTIVTDDGVEIDGLTGCTKGGLRLKIEDVPDSALADNDKFFACSQCGRIFWVKF
jgi:hypothetical protein